ncbi:MAG: PAS domain S-box protein, partial [Treponema sp.]|nr:PAS domain S-box protein [Treponema sp.]
KTLHCTHLMNRHIQIHDNNDQVLYLQIQAICKDNPSECIVSMEDVTELETNRQLEEKARNTLQLFMDNIPEPVIITDQNGNIIQVNRSLEKLYGYSKEEVLGKNPRIFNPGKEIYETIGLTEELYYKQFTELWESLLDT